MLLVFQRSIAYRHRVCYYQRVNSIQFILTFSIPSSVYKMDFKDENTVLDTTKVEQQDKQEILTVLSDNNSVDIAVISQGTDESKISSINLAISAVCSDSDANNSKIEEVEEIPRAALPSSVDTSEGNENQSQGTSEEASIATSSDEGIFGNMDESKISSTNLAISAVGSDSDANNSKIEKVEEISRASLPLSVDISEGNENQSQGMSEEASIATSSDEGIVRNMEGEKDRKYTDWNPTDAFKTVLELYQLEHNIGDRIPPFKPVGNGEKRLVDLPGKLKSVKSLKELSARKIPELESISRKTRNLSENEIHQKMCDPPNSYLSYKVKEQYAGSSNSSELEPGLSDMPLAEGQDKTIVSTEHGEVESSGEGSERKAFFYISSSSIPGMNDGWEWPSVSVGYHMPSARTDRHFVRQESREPVSCLGTQRCHYIVIAIALLTTIIGCIVYHLSHSGIVPDVLRPVGSTTAFMSFGVCVFSTIYISYLKNYIQLIPMVPNYEMLGDVDSVMAMNRTSNPEFVYTDGLYRTEDADFIRQTQSADVLDRRGYCRIQSGSQTEVKRYTDELGTEYSSPPHKKFKTECVVPDEIIQLSDLGFASKPSSEETVESQSGNEVSG